MENTKYAYRIDVPIDFDTAVDKTTEALSHEGFGVLTEIDVKATLKKKLDAGEDFTLVNVLSPEQFDKKHIPGSINIPLGAGDFGQKFKEKVPKKDHEVVVYCASMECESSPTAARRLEEMGYTNVVDYEGGMKNWIKKGFQTEGTQSR